MTGDGRLNIGKLVEFHLATPARFLDVYFNTGGMGGVLVKPAAGVSVGDQCRLEFNFVSDAAVFHSRGIARWNRPSAARGLPAGVGVEFLESERDTRDTLLDYAQGKKVHIVQRQSRRFPVLVVVEYAADSVFMTDMTDDLSAEGCFVVTQSLFELGQQLKLKLKPPGFRRAISVQAEVVWLRREGLVGMGLKFVHPGWYARRKITALLERIRLQGGMPLSAE